MKWYLYDWFGLNVWLFHLINSIHTPFLDRVMLAVTAAASHELFTFYLAVLSLTAVSVIARAPRDTIRFKSLLWVSVIAVFCIAYLLDSWFVGSLKPLLDFPRPPLALPIETVHIVGEAEYHHSMPSGHASFAMLIAASIWPLLLSSWQKYAAVCFVISVGLSRVSLGAHFPADVMAGWISSLLIVLAVRLSIDNLFVVNSKGEK